ncbi:Bug family tripartite tricarboxylate transporter substrate binding protein [Variovorax sp. GT1P44]|uniref:Bug family tripartite tricarboxylate transporter substrate binding protein n=1 Tax=Variovorax sp. GT1P44 TaxID=3443742 RepID=UPI003F485B4B
MGAAMLAPAIAQKSWPDGPVTIIVPFGTGNGLDVMARNYATQLGQQLNAPVIVDNKEGAGGLIGTMAAARATPNGRTLLFTAEYPFLTTPYLQAGQTYDPTSGFTPIAKVARAPHVLVVSGNSRFKTVDDLMQFAKSNPGQLNFASSGVGTPSHLYAEKLLKDLGIAATHVAYKSTGTATTDTMSGQVQLYLPSLSAVLPLLQDGKLRALAVGSSKPLAKLAGVPTFAEVLKQPGYEAYVWFGFLAPKGTPLDVVDRLQREIEAAAKSPTVERVFAQTDAEAANAGARQFAAEIAEGEKRARNLLAMVGASPK